MTGKLFGLDIGTTTIKAVWLGKDKNFLTFQSCITVPTPARGMLSEAQLDQEEMANAIRKMMMDAKIGTKNCSIALADNQVFTKVIEMPVLSEAELSSAIKWEAEQYIPAQLSTMTLDWKVLRPKTLVNGVEKMQVLLIAASTALIQRYQLILELAGLTPVSVETETISAIRSILVGDKPPTSLIINIGALSTSLAILQDGVMVFTYTIPLGGLAMNRAIASDFGFNPQQAEQYKKTYGIVDKSFGGKIAKAIQPILQSILVEVKKSLAFYSEKYKNNSQVTQIVLSGGTAKLPGIDIYFAQNIGVETVISNPWKAFNVQNTPAEVLDSGTDYTIAFGLALKAYEQ